MDTAIEFIANHSDTFKDICVHPITSVLLVIITLIAESLRTFLLYKYEDNVSKFNGHKNIYLFTRFVYESLVMFGVSYAMVKITGAIKTAYVLNYLFCPLVGFLAGIVVDNKIIIPIEKIGNLGDETKKDDGLNDKEKARKDDGANTETNISTEVTNSDEIWEEIRKAQEITFGK